MAEQRNGSFLLRDGEGEEESRKTNESRIRPTSVDESGSVPVRKSGSRRWNFWKDGKSSSPRPVASKRRTSVHRIAATLDETYQMQNWPTREEELLASYKEVYTSKHDIAGTTTIQQADSRPRQLPSPQRRHETREDHLLFQQLGYMLPIILDKKVEIATRGQHRDEQGRPVLRILDVGCGSASLTISLAGFLTGASSTLGIPYSNPSTDTTSLDDGEEELDVKIEVVGVDVFSASISVAKVYAEEFLRKREEERSRRVQTAEGNDLRGTAITKRNTEGARGCEISFSFLATSAHTLPFPSSSFDMVFTHQSLAHFPRPEAAVREMWRVVASNRGLLCLKEGDLSTVRFGATEDESGERRVRDLGRCFEMIVRLHEENGGSAAAGRLLKKWVLEAGVPSSSIILSRGSVTMHSTAEERKAYGLQWVGRCLHGVFAERAMSMEAGQKELEDWAGAWKGWVEDEEGWCGMMNGEIVCRNS